MEKSLQELYIVSVAHATMIAKLIFVSVICVELLTIVAPLKCEHDINCLRRHDCTDEKCKRVSRRKLCWDNRNCPIEDTCYFFECKPKYP